MNAKIIKPVIRFMGWSLFIISLHSNAQKSLTNEEWIEDLRFLQTTIKEEYSFLFKKITAKKFDSIVSEFEKNIPNYEDHQILIGFARILASFGYGHTDIAWWESGIPIHNLPISFYQFKDGLYIQGAHLEYQDIVGAKVLKVEEKDLEQVFNMLSPAIPVENEQYLKNYGPIYLTFPEFLHAQGIMNDYKKEVRLTLKLNDKIFEKIVSARPLDFFFAENYGLVPLSDEWVDSRDRRTSPLYLKNLDKYYYFERIQDNTLYVRHSFLIDDPDKSIEEFYKEVFNYIEHKGIEKLILDLRLNEGGDQYKNKSIITRILGSKKINQVGKLMVIIGRKTFSACMNLVNDLHSYSNAIFVGEPTGENINFYGDNRKVNLPHSGLGANLSFAWWQDKPQWENKKWLAPHIPVESTFEEYKSNQDPVLQAAIDFSEEDFILNPIGHLVNLYFSGQQEDLIREAQTMIENPIYDFVNIKDEFNTIANRFAKNGENEYAIGFHKINLRLFPDSAKTMIELADLYMKMGQKSKAYPLYQKSISMKLTDEVYKSVNKKIREIQSEKF